MKSPILLAAALCVASVSVVALQRPGEPQIKIHDLERRVHELINKEREKEHLFELKFDDDLGKIARAHSADMAKRKFFNHVNPNGQNATDRGRLAGYKCRKNYGPYFTDGLAENIFQGNLYSRITFTNGKPTYSWYTPEQIAREAVYGWMHSAGHRKNILTTTYQKEGIGIAIDSDDQVLVTEVFC
jgi:uncharacterized protein YkwD